MTGTDALQYASLFDEVDRVESRVGGDWDAVRQRGSGPVPAPLRDLNPPLSRKPSTDPYSRMSPAASCPGGSGSGASRLNG